MIRYIAVVGEQSADDRRVLDVAAASAGCDVVALPPGSAARSSSDLPCGYVSYLPCRASDLLDFYAAMPVGMAQDFPFFQRISTSDDLARVGDFPLFGMFRSPLTAFDADNMVRAMTRVEASVRHCRELVAEVARYRHEKNNLMRVGMALSSANELDAVLALILSQSREAVCADAGSIYVREQQVSTGMLTNRILFKVAQNDSVDLEEKPQEIPIPISDTTISGHVALTGQTLNIADVYALDTSVPYTWGRGFDRRFGYRTKSMLTVPLRNLAGEVVGVLQLMNKKREDSVRLASSVDVDRHVVAFDRSDEEFIHSIAPLAAVSIERVQLYQSIQDIFEGYLSSSAAAIDERDRVTSGHSRRVMGYAMAFVGAINDDRDGPFAQTTFSPGQTRQFKFAALLHDIGKIGVPEALLTRECRLTNGEMATIRMRAEYVKMLLGHAREPDWADAQVVEQDLALIEEVNRAGFLPDDKLARLSAIRAKTYADTRGQRHPFITDAEWELLSVRRGNLTARERDIINSHAQATRRILSKIPWTQGLRAIPDIASHHHEKIDGTGYPDGLRGTEISLESKILAIVDIYEALVAQDRPYKRVLPPEKAIEILREEARANHLDTALVEFFVAKNIWRLYIEKKEEGVSQQ